MPIPLYDWIRGATEDDLRAVQTYYSAPNLRRYYAGTLGDIGAELDRRRHGKIMGRLDDIGLSEDERHAISESIAEAQRVARRELELQDHDTRAKARLEELLSRSPPPIDDLADERKQWAPKGEP